MDLTELISREIWSLDEAAIGNFNTDQFKQLRSFAARKRYAEEHLPRIASGSARIVYEFGDDKVLKLAKNPKGFSQNELEIELGYNDYYAADFVTQVFDFDQNDDAQWLIAERGKKLTPNRFTQITGVNIRDLERFLRNFELQNRGQRKLFSQDKELEQELWENEFSSGIVTFMQNYDMSAGDLGRISSYGEVIRNGQPDVVLTDYGLNENIWSSHYNRTNEAEVNYNDELENFVDTDNMRDGGYAGWALLPNSVSQGGLEGDDLNEGVADYNNLGLVIDNDMYYLYDPRIVDVIDNQDWEEMEDYILGGMATRYNEENDAMEIVSIAAKKGYGPLLYLIGMSAAGNKGLIPSRHKNEVTPEAKNVWKEFFQGQGKPYIAQTIDLKDQIHPEPYLNKKYITSQPIDTYKMYQNHQNVISNDPYGEREHSILELGDAFLTKEINKIYHEGVVTQLKEWDDYHDIGDQNLKKAVEYIEGLPKVSKNLLNDISNLYKGYLISSQNIERAMQFARDDIGFFNKIINIQNLLKNFGLIKEDLVYWHTDGSADPESDEYKIGAESLNEDVNENFAYHVTRRKNLPKIKSKGLEARVPEDYGDSGDMKGVYLFKTLNDVQTALYQWLGERIEEWEEETGEDYDEVILKINTNGLDLMDSVEYEWISPNDIEPNRIVSVLEDKKETWTNEDGTSLYRTEHGTVNPSDNKSLEEDQTIVSDEDANKLENIFDDYVGIVSPHQLEDNERNNKASKELKNLLNKFKFEYVIGIGEWDNDTDTHEQSYIIKKLASLTPKEFFNIVSMIAKKFEQEAFIYGKKGNFILYYVDGKKEKIGTDIEFEDQDYKAFDFVSEGLVTEAGAGINRLLNHMKENDFAIMSANRNDYDMQQNKQSNEMLSKELQSKQAGFINLIGHWEELQTGQASETVNVKEQSFFIPKPEGMDTQDFKEWIIALGGKFGQDAVLIGTPEEGVANYFMDGHIEQKGKPNLLKINKAYSQLRKKPDATFVFEERIKTWMPKMTEPVIKKSCKLGGKKDGTSDDCSQGDTGAVSYKKIKDGQSHKPNKPNVAEEEKWFDRSINEGRVPYGRTYWGWISPEGEFYEVPKLKHAEFITRRYPDEYWDLDATFDKAFADGWLRVIYEKDGFSGALSINGDNEEKIKDAILKYYQDLVKYGANSIYVDAGDGGKSFYTGSKEGKEKVTSYLTEKEELNEVGEANIEPYQITADVVQDDGMEFSFTTEGGQEYVIQAGFNIMPKQYFIEDENMSDADQSFFYGEMPSKMVNLSISYTLREHHEKLRDARPATYMDNVRDRFGKGKDQEDNYPTVNTGEPLKIMSTISLATKAAYKKAVEKFGIVNMISYVPKRDKENDLRRERMNQIFVEKGLQKNGIPIKKKIKTGGQILYIISDGEMRMGESETQGVEESYINNMNEDIMSLQQLPFQKEIKGMGGKIYSVGGAVRDEFLGKDSKDLDILITGVPMEKLEMIIREDPIWGSWVTFGSLLSII